MIRLERDLYNFSGISLLMNLLHARSTAWYSVKKQTLCLCVLTSSDKIEAIGAGSGMTGRMPGFIGVTSSVPQWVLNMVGCAVKTMYPNVPHLNVQSTADKNEFSYTLRFVI